MSELANPSSATNGRGGFHAEFARIRFEHVAPSLEKPEEYQEKKFEIPIGTCLHAGVM
jgi:hypothetical protein